MAALACAAAIVAPAAADAAGEPHYGCKKVHTGKAQANPSPRGRPPLAIGDSTMILPIPNLGEAGFSVNARGCRGMGEAIDLMAKLRDRGRLPHLVVVAVYSNGGIRLRNVDEALDILGPRRVLALVTEYNAENGRRAARDTGTVFKARRLHRKQIAVLDWVDYSRPHHAAEPVPGAWFLPDLYHPNFTGAQEYANFLSALLRFAPPGRHPH
jgi:hypothetical protein